jgi:hypothetical protein
MGSLTVGFMPIWNSGSPNEHLPYWHDQGILGAMGVSDLWLIFFLPENNNLNRARQQR